ncbi:unnamed protein product [Paramecium pentaurelia]|uniref:Uncharacterized protein n=1 Tax=Paramecium pentaurelia TaxID=43138 RepID=A0A8S1XB94_9CILI|nr:unnamed protein product [Paramecium pentaurelia]
MGQFLYKQGIWRRYGSDMQKEKLLLLQQVKFIMILIQLLMQKQTFRMQMILYIFAYRSTQGVSRQNIKLSFLKLLRLN